MAASLPLGGLLLGRVLQGQAARPGALPTSHTPAHLSPTTGVFDNGQAGTLIGGIAVRNSLVQVGAWVT